MAGKKTRYRAKGSGVHIDVTWLGEEVRDAFIELAVEELQPVSDAMLATAQELCPVGTYEKLSPTYSRAVLATTYGAKRITERLKVGSKRGYLRRRDYRTTKPVRTGEKWQSRQPGRLRASIQSSVVVRNDKTAILLFLEAGSRDAWYASFVELGTYKMKPQPFMRPAYNQHLPYANRAILRALERLGRLS